jgi:hypothetical protein
MARANLDFAAILADPFGSQRARTVGWLAIRSGTVGVLTHDRVRELSPTRGCSRASSTS